jgi:hypothetical protein
LTIKTILLILFGIFIGFYLATTLRKSLLNCKTNLSCCPNSVLYDDNTDLNYESNDEDVINENLSNNNNNSKLIKNVNGLNSRKIKIYKTIEPDKNLVFIGVMTAQKYLDTRANSVYNTWGRSIPGKMSFFSRSGSSSVYKLPLVSLPGVDDRYIIKLIIR